MSTRATNPPDPATGVEASGASACSAVRSDVLVTAINAAWCRLYGGSAVFSEQELTKRIELIASDRDCWVANAKANQREYQRLQLILKQNISVRPPGGSGATSSSEIAG